MASVTIGTTTLWNDSGTGVGPLVWEADLKSVRWAMEALIQGGFVANDGGDEPGAVLVGCKYCLTDSELSALISTAEGARRTTGTLSVAPGQSFAGCCLVKHRLIRGPAVRVGSATMKYEGMIQYLFQRMY